MFVQPSLRGDPVTPLNLMVDRSIVPNPVVLDSPQPAKKNGRPLGSRSSYYIQLEKMAARRAGLMDGVLCDPAVRLPEAAVVAGLSVSTLRRLARTGAIAATKTTPRHGHWRIKLSTLKSFSEGAPL
jgi:excisionase family DNA binding protein